MKSKAATGIRALTAMWTFPLQQQQSHLRVAQPGLGLTLKLRGWYLDRNNTRKTLPDMIT
jgi:hypothetical protein